MYIKVNRSLPPTEIYMTIYVASIYNYNIQVFVLNFKWLLSIHFLLFNVVMLTISLHAPSPKSDTALTLT